MVSDSTRDDFRTTESQSVRFGEETESRLLKDCDFFLSTYGGLNFNPFFGLSLKTQSFFQFSPSDCEMFVFLIFASFQCHVHNNKEKESKKSAR